MVAHRLIFGTGVICGLGSRVSDLEKSPEQLHRRGAFSR